MELTLQELLKAALRLSEDERVVLAEELLASVAPVGGDAEWAAAWQTEVDRRWRELESGEIQAVPWSDVDDQLRHMSVERKDD